MEQQFAEMLARHSQAAKAPGIAVKPVQAVPMGGGMPAAPPQRGSSLLSKILRMGAVLILTAAAAAVAYFVVRRFLLPAPAQEACSPARRVRLNSSDREAALEKFRALQEKYNCPAKHTAAQEPDKGAAEEPKEAVQEADPADADDADDDYDDYDDESEEPSGAPAEAADPNFTSLKIGWRTCPVDPFLCANTKNLSHFQLSSEIKQHVVAPLIAHVPRETERDPQRRLRPDHLRRYRHMKYTDFALEHVNVTTGQGEAAVSTGQMTFSCPAPATSSTTASWSSPRPGQRDDPQQRPAASSTGWCTIPPILVAEMAMPLWTLHPAAPTVTFIGLTRP